MATEVNESVLSFLTSETWLHDLGQTIFLKFEHAGMGRELVMWIAAEFTWKGLHGTTFETLTKTTINTTPTINANPKASSLLANSLRYNFNRVPSQLLAEFDIELQFTKRRAPDPSDPEGRRLFNEYYLKEEEFRCKEFHVRLEKGLFVTPEVAEDPGSYPFTKLSVLRLVFDKQVFPPAEEYKVRHEFPASWVDTFRFTEFVARPLDGCYEEPWWVRCSLM